MSGVGNGYAARIEELTRRANSCDTRADRQWEKIGQLDQGLAVAVNDVEDIEQDVDEVKGIVTEMRDEFRASKRWLVTTAVSFAVLSIAVAGLAVSIAAA